MVGRSDKAVPGLFRHFLANASIRLGMSGNLGRRRMVKFMPAEFKLIETRQPPLKEQYDEWLAWVICYAFSVPASAFVSQVNRATSETLRIQASQECLVPLKAWVKSALDSVIQVYMNEPDLEFTWVGDDAIDPLQQAQTLNILVSAGIKTREEARADLGLAPEGTGGLGKVNPYHDERGRFTTPEDAADPGGEAPPTARPRGIQVAAGGILGFEPFQQPEEPPAKPAENAPTAVAPKGTIADAVAPNGVLPGIAPKGIGYPREMPASDNPNAAAAEYVTKISTGQTPVASTPIGDPGSGGFYAEMPDGTYITYRPAGQAGDKTDPTTASVDVNSDSIKLLNGEQVLKLKFPQK